MRGTRSYFDIGGVVFLKSPARLFGIIDRQKSTSCEGKGLTSLCPRAGFLDIDPENAVYLT